MCSRGLIMILSLSISSYSCFKPFSYIAESSSRLRQYFCESAACSSPVTLRLQKSRCWRKTHIPLCPRGTFRKKCLRRFFVNLLPAVHAVFPGGWICFYKWTKRVVVNIMLRQPGDSLSVHGYIIAYGIKKRNIIVYIRYKWFFHFCLTKVIKKNVSDLRFCKLFLRYFEDDIRLTKPVLHILMRAVIVRRNAGVFFKKPRKIRVIWKA